MISTEIPAGLPEPTLHQTRIHAEIFKTVHYYTYSDYCSYLIAECKI